MKQENEILPVNPAICKKCKFLRDRFASCEYYECTNPEVVDEQRVGDFLEGFTIKKTYPYCKDYNSDGRCPMYKKIKPWEYITYFIKRLYASADDEAGKFGSFIITLMLTFISIPIIVFLLNLFSWIMG